MKGELNIETIYAYVVRDDDGTEGVTAARTETGWMPLVGADTARAESYEKVAQEIADATGKSIQLLHFTGRKLIKTIEPNRTKPSAGAERIGGDDSSIMGIR